MLLLFILLFIDQYLFIFAVIIIGLYHSIAYYKVYTENKGARGLRPANIWKYYKEICKNKMVLSDIYFVNKAPNTIKYILMNEDIKGILEDFHVISLYQEDLLADIIILTEYFCKVHFNVVIGKYDACTYSDILKDIQREILQKLSITIFNIPSISTMVDIPDINTYIDTKKRDLHALTNKYMNILKHKYNEQCAHLHSFT
jgi:hypothetical protein